MSERAETLYERARSLPPEARTQFLSQACAGDHALEAELRSLLEHAECAESFFTELAGSVASTFAGWWVGHYRVSEILGRGGMGLVYRAHDSRLDRDVALKFLPSHLSAQREARERLLVEARAAAALDHPNVCSVHEIGETTDGRPFIAMACYDGETLKDRLARGALGTDEAVSIATQIARGLAAAHARGIVHRDVKPGNVMLCADGTVRLLDFGLAKLTDVTLTGPNITPGTIAYMSPEQARGGAVDARTDLWSLGVVLYEMLAGERPFPGGNDRALIQAILHQRADPLRGRSPGTPEWLERVVDRLLEKDLARRYGSAEDFLHDLTSPTSAKETSPPRRTLGWRPVAAAGIGLLALLALLSIERRDGASARPGPSSGGAVPGPETAPAPAIAVLPFSVLGEGLDVWREGLVDLLSRGLDGTGGLRTIHSRTVLARWSEAVGESDVADLARSLDVARRTGARYALVGSAVAAGDRIRLVADIHDLAGRESLGQAQAEGSADSILALADRLGMETVGAILEKDPDEIAPIDLAGVTTGSLTALKAYLEGEARFRRSEFRRASDAWERAVRADSTFALAYLNLAEAYGWDENTDFERMQKAMSRAFRLADRLPPREEAMIRARWAGRAGRPDGVKAIETAVRKYPDDAGGWYALGESYYHDPRALRGAEEIERVFRQAAALQPATAPYRAHLIDLAFDSRPDSARIAREVETYERLAPGTARARAGRLALDLTFGDPGARARARAELDTVTVEAAIMTYAFLGHPRFAEARELVYPAIVPRLSPGSRAFGGFLRFSGLALTEGRLREALSLVNDPMGHSVVRNCGALYLSWRGFPIPDHLLEERLGLKSVDNSLLANPEWVTCAAAYAAEHNRWDDHDSLAARARQARLDWLGVGDSAGAHRWDRVLRNAEAHRLWRRGRSEEALRAFEGAAGRASIAGWWDLANMGQLALELGRLEQAERILRAQWSWGGALARLELARILERTGREAEARQAYEEFAHAWRSADPELRGWVDEARQAIDRLSRPAN